MKKLRKIILIILAALAVLIGAYALWERPPELEPAPTAAPTQTRAPAETQTTQPEQAAEPEPELPTEPLNTERSGDSYTFLLVGRDDASNSTDTIIVGRLDARAHSVDCVSIPRDTLINIGWATTPKKINAVYPGWENTGRDGVTGLRQQLTALLGFDVDCYAVINTKAASEAVDAIGGVWFDVPQDMDYDDPTQDLHIHVKAGYQKLNGADAVKVARFREGYAGGDIERIGVQQSLLRAIADQMLTLGNVPNLGTLIDVLVENTDTSLTAANMAWFARQFLQCGLDGVRFHTLPWGAACYINGVSYVSVDADAWLALVNERLNPYDNPVTAANVNLLCANGDGTVLWSTSGVVAGGEDSFYCLPCTVANGAATYHRPGACPEE